MNMQVLSAMGGALAIAVCAGCSNSGDDFVPVTGTVTCRGQPVEGVNVAFFPENGRPAVGRTDVSGRFVLSTLKAGDGALVGTHKVAITDAPGKTPPAPGSREAVKWPPPKSLVPERYGDPVTSGLTAKVEKEATNDFVFDIAEK